MVVQIFGLNAFDEYYTVRRIDFFCPFFHDRIWQQKRIIFILYPQHSLLRNNKDNLKRANENSPFNPRRSGYLPVVPVRRYHHHHTICPKSVSVVTPTKLLSLCDVTASRSLYVTLSFPLITQHNKGENSIFATDG